MSSLFTELKRRNVFRVAMAYGVVGWLLAEVSGFLFQTFEAPAWVIKVFATLIILGFPLALFLSQQHSQGSISRMSRSSRC